MRLTLVLAVFFLNACSPKEPISSVHIETSQLGSQLKTQCSVFSDNTFQGFLKKDELSNRSRSDCLILDIVKYPKNIFSKKEIYVQAYPFKSEEAEIKHGKALIMSVFYKNGNSNQASFQTRLLDQDFITKTANYSLDNFFKDHYIKFCDIGREWKGMKLVTYYQGGETAINIRTTSFLIPPFFIDPALFESDESSKGLLSFHPFLEYKNMKTASEFEALECSLQ